MCQPDVGINITLRAPTSSTGTRRFTDSEYDVAWHVVRINVTRYNYAKLSHHLGLTKAIGHLCHSNGEKKKTQMQGKMMRIMSGHVMPEGAELSLSHYAATSPSGAAVTINTCADAGPIIAAYPFGNGTLMLSHSLRHKECLGVYFTLW